MSNKTIDEKVVEMRFDNKQFEQGVKQTRNSINKLKTDLDFSKVNSEISGLARGLNTISLAKIARNTTQLANRFSFLGETIEDVKHKAVDGLFKSVTAAFTQMRTGGWARSLNISNAEFQIKGLKKDWDALKEDIDYGVKDTAYGFDEAASAAAQFAASGLEAGESMKTALRAISGVSAMTNSSYSDIARIFTTVSGNGRLMTMQLNQISERGLNAASTIADYFNSSTELMDKFYELYNSHKKKTDEEIVRGTQATEAAIRTMTTNGAIDFQTFADAMDSAFGQHAKEGNKTFTGSLANMKAALSRIGAEITGPLQEGMITVFNDLRVIFNTIHKVAQPVLDDVASIITMVLREGGPVDKVLSGINSVLETMYEKGEQIQEKVETAVETVTGGRTLEDLQAIGQAIHDVMMGYYDIGDARKELLAQAGFDYQTVQNGVNEVMLHGKTIDEYLQTLQTDVAETGDTVQEAIEKADLTEEEKKAAKLQYNIQMIHESMNNFVTGFKNIGNNLVSIFKEIGTAFTDVFDAPDFGKLKSFSEGFVELTESLKPTEKHLDNVRRTFRGLFAAIDIVFRAITGLLKGIFKLHTNLEEFGGGILGVTGDLGDLIYALDNAIKEGDFFGKVFGAIGTVLSKIGHAIGFVVGHIRDFITSGASAVHVGDGFKAVGEALSKAFSAIGKVFKSFWNWLKSTGLGPALLNALTVAGQLLAGAILMLGEALGKLFEKIKNSPITAKVIDKISSSFTKLVDKMKNLKISDLKFPEIKVPKSLDEFLVSIGNFTRKVKKKFKEFLESGPDRFFSFVNKSTDGIVKLKDLFKGVTKEADSMSPVLTSVSGAWGGAMDGFAKEHGARKGILGVLDALKAFGGSIVENFKAFVKWCQENLDWDKIFNTAGILIALNSINRITKALQGFGSMAGGIGKLLEGVGQGVASFLQGAGEMVVQIGKGVRSYLRGKALKEATTGILALAAAMLAMVLALKLICDIYDKYGGKTMWKSVAVLGALAAVLAGLMTAAGFMSKHIDAKTLVGAAITMLALSVAVKSFATAISMVAAIDEKASIRATVELGILMGGLLAAMALVSKRQGDVKLAVTSFVALASGLKIMGVVIQDFANMDLNDYASGMIRISIAMVALVTASNMLKPVAADSKQAVGTLYAMMIALGAMALIIKGFGKMGSNEFSQGIRGVLIAMATLVGGIVILVGLTKKMGAHALYLKALSQTMISFGIAIAAISLAIKALAHVDGGDIAKASIAIGGLITVLALAVKLMSSGNKYSRIFADGAGLAKTITSIGIAIAGISAAVVALSLIPVEKAMPAALMIGGLIMAIGGAMRLIGDSKGATASLKSLAIAIAAISAIVVALALLPVEKTGPVVAMVDSLMLSLAAMCISMGVLSKATQTAKIGKFAVMIGLIVGAIAGLSALMMVITNIPANTDALLPLVESIAIVVNAMVPMVVAIGVLAKFLGDGGFLSMVSVGTGALAVVAEFLLGVPALFAALGAISGKINEALKEAGSKSTFESAIQDGIDILKLVVGGLTEIFTTIGNEAAEAFAYQMGLISTGIQSVGDGMQSFMKGLSGLNKDTLKNAKTFSEVIGVLSEAAKNITGYDEKTGNKLNYLSELALQLGPLAGGIVSFQNILAGGKIDIKKFTQVTLGLSYLSKFAEVAAKVKDTSPTAMIDLCDHIVDMIYGDTSDSKDGGLSAVFTAVNEIGNDVIDSGVNGVKKLAKIIPALQEFQKLTSKDDGFHFSLGSLIEIDSYSKTQDFGELGENVSSFCNAMFTVVTSFANTDPETGGVTDDIWNRGIARASKMSELATALTGFQDLKPKVDTIATMFSNVAGGIVYKDQKWDEFGQDLAGFFSALATIVVTIGNDYDADVMTSSTTRNGSGHAHTKKPFNSETLKAASERLDELSAFAPKLEAFQSLKTEVDSVKSFFVGKKEDWGSFGADLQTFMQSIASAVAGLAEQVTEDKNTKAGNAFDTVYKFLNELNSIGADNIKKEIDAISNLGSALTNYGTGLANYNAAINTPSTDGLQLSTAVNASTDKFKNNLSNQTEIQNGIMSAFKGAMDAVIKFLKEDSGYADTLNTVGKTYIKAFLDGFTGGDEGSTESDAKKAVNDVCLALSTISGENLNKMVSAGKQATNGFVNGILEKVKSGDVAAAGTKIGNAAYEAARKALDEHSPSRKMYQVGAYAVEGFVNGITLNADSATREVGEMMLSLVSYLKRGIGAQADFSHQIQLDSTAVGYLAENLKSYKMGIMSYKDALNHAANSVISFSAYLYANSDAYKQDQDNLNSLKEEYEAAVKTYQEAQEKVRKSSRKTRKQSIEDLEEAETAMNDAKKNINKALDSIVDHIKDAYNELHASLTNMIEEYTSFQSAIGKMSSLDIFSSNSAYESQVQNEQELAAAEAEVAQARSDLAAAEARSAAVQGRSKIALGQIAEAQERLNSALEHQQELMKNTDPGEAGQKLLANMKANVEQYKTWLKELSDLQSVGLSSEALSMIKEQGIQGAEQVKTIWSAIFENGIVNQDFINEFNSLFGEKQALELQGFKQQLQDSETDIEVWKNKLIEAKNAGFDQGLLLSIAKLGPSNQTQLNLMLKDYQMYGSQAVNLWNTKFQETHTNAQYWASQIMAIIADLNAQIAATNSALSALESRSASASTGFDALESRAVANGISVADAFAYGVESGFQIASPSKRFARIGKFVALGFAKGLKDSSEAITDASSVFSDGPISTIQVAMDQARALLSGDIDPTIRPMIDLSNIQNGSNQIHAMFDGMNLDTKVSSEIAYKVDNADQYAPNNIMRRYIQNHQPESITNDNHMDQQNTFNIYGSDPRETANEVDIVLAQKARRRKNAWA